MYKIAVLGDRDSIYGFAALGLETFPVSTPEAGAKMLKRLASGEYAVIYITEALQAKLEKEIDAYRSSETPAIIPIPGVAGNTGMGIMNVRKSVEQAVGSDIIFNENR
ncbi:V-type ATP synthase subunit F [Anaerobium acetethylicum]|uniref:V/A-type H+-transporting ATPase subunit F n=1 Tax=Anaerobium acetethylicum TaxID=1619234 RepID=A0A1D3TTN0_9FIRM|nr:V-type ATP synthase subunit F [Anaerobium acetethylicum]SCP97294.1 V/A-type H+-transporting ATPase subunit F [Anaerobium acetethylicum]